MIRTRRASSTRATARQPGGTAPTDTTRWSPGPGPVASAGAASSSTRTSGPPWGSQRAQDQPWVPTPTRTSAPRAARSATSARATERARLAGARGRRRRRRAAAAPRGRRTAGAGGVRALRGDVPGRPDVPGARAVAWAASAAAQAPGDTWCAACAKARRRAGPGSSCDGSRGAPSVLARCRAARSCGSATTRPTSANTARSGWRSATARLSDAAAGSSASSHGTPLCGGVVRGTSHAAGPRVLRTVRCPPGRMRTKARSTASGPVTPTTVPASGPVTRTTSQGRAAADRRPGRVAGSAPCGVGRRTPRTAPGSRGRSPTTWSSVSGSPSTTNVAYRSSGRRTSVARGARRSTRRVPGCRRTSSPGCRVTRTAPSDGGGRVMGPSLVVQASGSGPLQGFLCMIPVSTGPPSCSLRHNPWVSAPTRGRPDVRPGDDTAP